MWQAYIWAILRQIDSYYEMITVMTTFVLDLQSVLALYWDRTG